MEKKIVSLLLAAAIIFSIWGTPVMAESAMEKASAARAALPANPVHTCTMQNDGKDTTTWSYVYFGSYPQSEVTGAALTAEITGASYDVNGDAWVNGIKYRKVGSRYFKWERIKWRVLQVSSSTMLVMADMGLDCKCYHDTAAEVVWKTSTLRTWLNNSFYGVAFNSDEQKAISAQTVVNKDEDGNVISANNTSDKLFILSLEETRTKAYGFCSNISVESVSRRVKVSDYASAKGASRKTNGGYAGEGYWWTRSYGSNSSNTYTIHYSGKYGRTPTNFSSATVSCVPVLNVSLSSNLWSMTNDGTSGAGGEEFGKLLERIKDELKETLGAYKNLSDYRDTQKEEINAIISAGNLAIDNAANEAEAKIALANAKTSLDQIKTAVEMTEAENQLLAKLLAEAKENSKNELNEYKNASDYREKEQDELYAAIEAGEDAIDAAEDTAGVEQALIAAKEALDKIKTDEQLTLEEKGGEEGEGQSSDLKGTSILGKLKAKKNTLLVKWKKQTDISGYQIQYSTNKKFKKNATKVKDIKKASQTKVKIKQLKRGKKYYVRIRTYQTTETTTLYSDWSKTKMAVIKK